MEGSKQFPPVLSSENLAMEAHKSAFSWLLLLTGAVTQRAGSSSDGQLLD